MHVLGVMNHTSLREVGFSSGTGHVWCVVCVSVCVWVCVCCMCVCVSYVQAYNGHFGVLEELLYKYQAYLDCKDEKGKCHFQLVHTHCQTMQLEL